MMRLILVCLLLLGSISNAFATELDQPLRPITEADTVLAVYVDAWGRDALAVILAIWPDGHAVWSGDRLHGGAPYRTGKVDPQKVAALVSQLEEDGLFRDEKLNDPHHGVEPSITSSLFTSFLS